MNRSTNTPTSPPASRSGHSTPRLIWLCIAALAATLAAPTRADAAKSASDVCKSIAKKAKRTLWNDVRKTGDELFCRKSWRPGTPAEMAGCALWTNAHLFTNKLKNRWNRWFTKAGAEWATWGPRAAGETWEYGTIRGGFKRTYFGPALAYNRSTVEVVKTGGSAAANITVCKLDYNSRVLSAQRKTFASGSGGVNRKQTFKFDNKDSYILAVVVDTPASANKFQYATRIDQQAIRNNIGKVKGAADLHVHQLVNLTFGGRMYWGQHDGPLAKAMHKEVNTATIANLTISNIGAMLGRVGASLDANILLAVLGGKVSDEGFFQLGGGGFPKWDKWPHHADRSHNALHIDWLHEAVKRRRANGSNLGLMVVSMVNNNILCSVLKLFDKNGNVPIWSGNKITGWKSKNWGCSDHENVMRQLEAIHALENKYPWYRVAMTPWHARQIIDEGDLAVVVSLETDKPLSSEGNNYGDWKNQLDRYRALGLTTLQIVHESDSKFAGAALHRNMMSLLQAIHWPIRGVSNLIKSGTTYKTFVKYQYTRKNPKNGKNEVRKVRFNSRGLTREGQRLIDEMVARRMPIDLAHASEKARMEIMKRVPDNYGLYDSHTKFEVLMRPNGQPDHGEHVFDREQEFLITPKLLPLYVKHKVLVGLRPTSIDTYDVVGHGTPVANTCPGSSRSFAQLIHYAHAMGLDFAYGTDFNTGVAQLGPRYGKNRCWAAQGRNPNTGNKLTNATTRAVAPEPGKPPRVEPIVGTNYYYDGMAVYGWLPELTEDLIRLNTPGAGKLRESAEAYIQMWERAYDAVPTAQPTTVNPNPGSVAMGRSCTSDGMCSTGRCSSVVGKGVCVCDDDGDCGSSRYCNKGFDLSRNTCERKKSDGSTCALANGGRQCKSGRCRSGRCYTPNSKTIGQTCYVGDECRVGKCNNAVDGTRGTCVCKSDSDCGSGKWCDRGVDFKKNVCKRKLNKGEVCGSIGELGVGHRCKSGKCKVGGTKLKCK